MTKNAHHNLDVGDQGTPHDKKGFVSSLRRQKRWAAPVRSLEWLDDRKLLSVASIAAEFRVNTFTTGTQETSALGSQSVAMASNGDFVVTWSSLGQDGDGGGVYGQRYRASGATQGAEFRINATTAGDQRSPAVAMANDGKFTVAWSGNGRGDGDGVFARLLVVPPGITVFPTTELVTTEAGQTAILGVVLDSQPKFDVIISLSSSDTTEGVLSLSGLTFSTANWNIAQMVGVTGVDDPIDEGDVAYRIVIAPAVSIDLDYNGLDSTDLEITSIDDDAAPPCASGRRRGPHTVHTASERRRGHNADRTACGPRRVSAPGQRDGCPEWRFQTGPEWHGGDQYRPIWRDSRPGRRRDQVHPRSPGAHARRPGSRAGGSRPCRPAAMRRFNAGDPGRPPDPFPCGVGPDFGDGLPPYGHGGAQPTGREAVPGHGPRPPLSEPMPLARDLDAAA